MCRVLCLLPLIITVAASPVAQPARATAGPTVLQAPEHTVQDWVWPLHPPPDVLRGFDPPAEPWLPGHRGVDLAARAGQDVRAAAAGVVTFAGWVAGRPVVAVSHGVLRTTYEPVEPLLSAGDSVAAGTTIGVVSRTPRHCGYVHCLHWGLRRGVVYLDPLAVFGRGPVRLFPLWDGSAIRPWIAGGAGFPVVAPGQQVPTNCVQAAAWTRHCSDLRRLLPAPPVPR